MNTAIEIGTEQFNHPLDEIRAGMEFYAVKDGMLVAVTHAEGTDPYGIRVKKTEYRRGITAHVLIPTDGEPTITVKGGTITKAHKAVIVEYAVTAAEHHEVMARLDEQWEEMWNEEQDDICYGNTTGEAMVIASGWTGEDAASLIALGNQVDEILERFGMDGFAYAGDALYESPEWAEELIADYEADPATVVFQLMSGQNVYTREPITV